MAAVAAVAAAAGEPVNHDRFTYNNNNEISVKTSGGVSDWRASRDRFPSDVGIATAPAAAAETEGQNRHWNSADVRQDSGVFNSKSNGAENRRSNYEPPPPPPPSAADLDERSRYYNQDNRHYGYAS